MDPVDLDLEKVPESSQSLYDSFNRAYDCEVVFHHEILREITSKQDVNSVAECGVFQGWTTALFMTCDIEFLDSYELDFRHISPLFLHFMKVRQNVKWSLNAHNTIEQPIEPADLVFLDTCHNYEFVRREIALQGSYAKKYIAVHDANYPPDSTPKKVRDAVLEYASKSHGVWTIDLDSEFDTGMVVLKRNTLLSAS